MKTQSPFDLSGQVVVVSGGSRGIGRAISLMMAGAGAKVVVASRKIEACEAVVAEIAAAGGEGLPVACNISHADQRAALVAAAEKRFGPVSTLVCNAAANVHYGPLATLDAGSFEKIMNTNVGSNIDLINRVAPGMAAAGGGAVILLASIAGMVGSKLIGAYALSKAADSQLARNYAVELGPKGIRVNAVCPATMPTPLVKEVWMTGGSYTGKTGTWEEKQVVAAQKYPLRRLGSTADCASLVVFLASDESTWMTGLAIPLDGGMSAG